MVIYIVRYVLCNNVIFNNPAPCQCQAIYYGHGYGLSDICSGNNNHSMVVSVIISLDYACYSRPYNILSVLRPLIEIYDMYDVTSIQYWSYLMVVILVMAVTCLDCTVSYLGHI
ncbi:hypothetical protein GDO81_020324 [Engystomops pustulosus]|uniref:Uncharacterized protein n=1 Tax=Engystomops pustulosus TaxID=76066 RepID=A0AAV6ZNC2_ENGPU|nr:hypothetical protein GDO81_020324 [Engystomops pustulosus]